MAKKAQKRKKATVKVIANGTNKVSLIFPTAAKIKGNQELSVAAVLKLLKGLGKKEADVEGQRSEDCPRHCSCLHVQAPSAVRG